MDEKKLLLNISLGPPTYFNEIISDMKLQKFPVESVFCHLQGENYEFKNVV